MGEFANTVLLVYAGLFPIVNPFGSMPLFLGLTRSRTDQQRNVLARRIAVNSFLLLLGSVFIGSHVLEFFGISLPVVRIAGGLVVTAFGWKLLNSDEPPERKPTSSEAPSSVPDSFYPVTMPLTVGPGSISVAITLGSQRPKAAGIEELLLLGGAAVLGILAIAVTVYLCYRFAERLAALLGTSGTNVGGRLSAINLHCIRIQILCSGWSTLDQVTG